MQEIGVLRFIATHSVPDRASVKSSQKLGGAFTAWASGLKPSKSPKRTQTKAQAMAHVGSICGRSMPYTRRGIERISALL